MLAYALALYRFHERSEDDFHIAKEGHVVHIFHIVLEFLFPGNGVASIHLRKSTEARAHIVTVFLLGIVSRQIFNQKRSRSNHSHIAFKNIEQFREFVEARATEKLAVSVQANIVREQVAVGVLFVRHRAELDELEDFFVEARARLRKERVALHLDCAEDSKHDEDRTQADDGCQSTEEIERALEEPGVHYSKHSLMVWMMASCCSGVILLSLGRQSPRAKMSAPLSWHSPAM